MRNSLMMLLSMTAFWQAVCLSGTASIVFRPFLFLGTVFSRESGVSSRFLLFPVLAAVFKPCALVLALNFGAMSASAEKVVKFGGFGIRPLDMNSQVCR
jgi:hypothetical protein